MSKIAVITSWDAKYQPIADVTLPILRAYCERHAYTLHTGTYHTDPSRIDTYGDRGKIDLFNQVYDSHDLVMWLDVDAIVMNHDKVVEDCISPSTPFVWTFDMNGPCSGFWIARCVDLVHHALNVVKNRCLEGGRVFVVEDQGPPHSVRLQLEPRGASDQKMMESLMGVPPFNRVFGAHNCLPGKEAGHCYHDAQYHGGKGAAKLTSQYEPGDWIVTAPSYPFEERLAILKSYAEKALPKKPPTEDFDRNWAGPPEHAPRIFRTQSEKDTWHACVVGNEYGLPEKLAPEDVVIDIGAHIGSFSYAAYLHGSRDISAFEIDPWHVEAAVVNLAGLEEHVAFNHAAVVRGDKHRAKTYHYNGAWNSFGLVGKPVLSISLDEIIRAVCRTGERVRFLKMDIEGGEWPVLYTCTMLDRVDEIAGEWHLVDDRSAPELANLPRPIESTSLFMFLRDQGFDDVSVMPTTSAQNIGNFHAKRTRKGPSWEAAP